MLLGAISTALVYVKFGAEAILQIFFVICSGKLGTNSIFSHLEMDIFCHFKFCHDRRNGLWMLLISYQMYLASWGSSENIRWIIHELSNYANSLELCWASISSDFREFSDRNYKLKKQQILTKEKELVLYSFS